MKLEKVFGQESGFLAEPLIQDGSCRGVVSPCAASEGIVPYHCPIASRHRRKPLLVMSTVCSAKLLFGTKSFPALHVTERVSEAYWKGAPLPYDRR